MYSDTSLSRIWTPHTTEHNIIVGLTSKICYNVAI